jgi:hypothetical protein
MMVVVVGDADVLDWQGAGLGATTKFGNECVLSQELEK